MPESCETQEGADLLLDQCRDLQGFLFGSGEPRPCDARWLKGSDSVFMDVHTGVLDKLLPSSHQRVPSNFTRSFHAGAHGWAMICILNYVTSSMR